MASQEQQPANPTETNIQRIMRQARERQSLQQQQDSSVVHPETNIQRLVRQAKERQSQGTSSKQSAVVPVEHGVPAVPVETKQSVEIKVDIPEAEKTKRLKVIKAEFLRKIKDSSEKQRLSEVFDRVTGGENNHLEEQLTLEDMDLWTKQNGYTKKRSGLWKRPSAVEKALLTKENLVKFMKILSEQDIRTNGRVRTALLVEFLHEPPENDMLLGRLVDFVKIAKLEQGSLRNYKDYIDIINRVGSSTKEDIRAALAQSRVNSSPPPLPASEAAVPTGKPEGELTEVQKAEQALKDAKKAALEAHAHYQELLEKNEGYISANEARRKAWKFYKQALDESGLEEAVFDTTSGKEQVEKLRASWEIQDEAAKAFRAATPLGQELYSKWLELNDIEEKARKALNQARAKAAALPPAAALETPPPAPSAINPVEPLSGEKKEPSLKEELQALLQGGDSYENRGKSSADTQLKENNPDITFVEESEDLKT